MHYLKPILAGSVSYGWNVAKNLADRNNPKAMVNILAHPIAFGQSVPDIVTKTGVVASIALLGVAVLTNSAIHLTLAAVILASSATGMLLSHVTNNTHDCLDLEASVERSVKSIGENDKKISEQNTKLQKKIEEMREVVDQANGVAQQMTAALENGLVASDAVKDLTSDDIKRSETVVKQLTERAEILAVYHGKCDQPATSKAIRLHKIMQEISALNDLDGEYEEKIEASSDTTEQEKLEDEQDEINRQICELERERNKILNEGVDN